MRLQVSKTKNAASFYVVKSVYENKRHSSRIVEKLGTYNDLLEKLGGRDPYEWAEEYVRELNRKEKEGIQPEVIARYSPCRQIDKDVRQSFNGGYLFLKRLYHDLGLHRICAEISGRHAFEYDLDSILSRLLYTRILYPGSKRSCRELSERFIEQPNFDLHQIYRALDVIDKETGFIQSELYQKSRKVSARNTSVLYYDLTNYFFQSEEEDGLRQYGVSKEHRPAPIVQMGLFMDGDGIPLAFSINPGNTNEQITLKPLERSILSDFELSRLVVCTDAGLSSHANRLFNSRGERAFVTTQSIKKLPQPLQEWALEPEGWCLEGGKGRFDLRTISEEAHRQSVFYKAQWVEMEGLRQQMIITYSLSYRDYARSVRERQVSRAVRQMEENPSRLTRQGQNDAKRFLKRTDITPDGEIASRTSWSLNAGAIDKEARYDGFYAVCTNLAGDVKEIIAINKRRWEIEECFRILKSEFKSRPVYLSRDERIRAHFTSCFLALVLFRYMERKLNNRFTCHDIISQLREMNFLKIPNQGYVPAYTRTDFTDALHEAFGFRTDYEIVTDKEMKRIMRSTKK